MWLESVPNVSEGRCSRTIESLAAAVRSGGARLLHQTSDSDHHRTVFTVVGEAEPLQASLLALYRRAIEVCDLRRHSGVHPRIGAVDVTPIVPLGTTPLGLARAVADRLAQAVAAEHRLPVFLYEASARQEDRRNLAHIRRGGMAGLTQKMARGWLPDYGPDSLHATAGGTVIGARNFLVAFNIQLATTEIKVARRIARRVRESSGGLPAVKALGIYLESLGQAQVSMNLVDYRRTSPFEVLARVRELAADQGVAVDGSELIGLIPEAALAGGDVSELQIRDWQPDRILERRLEAAGVICE